MLFTLEHSIAHILGDLRQYCIFCVSVKDLSLQQHSLPHLTSFLQETPMKPSQVPSKLSHPPPRRMLPLQSPELCHEDRLGPPLHPLYHLGPIHSSGFVPSSPVNIGSSANKLHPTPRDRLGPAPHSAHSPGSSRSRLVPVSSTNSALSSNLNSASPQLMKDLNNQFLPSHIRSDQVTESEVTLFYSGSKNLTAPRQESNKVLFSLF